MLTEHYIVDLVWGRQVYASTPVTSYSEQNDLPTISIVLQATDQQVYSTGIYA